MTSPLSFRDPAGQVVLHRGRVIRLVRREALPGLERFLASELHSELHERGQIVWSERVPSDEVTEIVTDAGLDSDSYAAGFEHPRIPFDSYPHEWSRGMLHAAGTLTLDLAETALKHGWGLKDATPFNVAFIGAKPIFFDVLSFEQRDPTDPTWLPYAQFVRTFLLPLLAAKVRGLSNRAIFSESREGLEPETMYDLLSAAQRLHGPGLTLVTLPKILGRRGNSTGRPSERRQSPEKVSYILERLFRHLRGALGKVASDGAGSRWAAYATSDVHSSEYHESKRQQVERILSQLVPRAVLDLGCNVGHYSVLAAKAGAKVVAVDGDPAVVDEAFRRSSTGEHDILTLVVDLADPTPGRGWRNMESRSFLARARDAFDAVLALALVHHLRIDAGVPMHSILSLLAELSRSIVIVEFIPPSDSMFKLLARGRDTLYGDADRDSFLAACGGIFEIVSSEPIGESGRELFVLRKLVA